MDWDNILNILSELAYLLIVFGVFFSLAIIKGRQSIINVITGLYLALLISIEFPYYKEVLGDLESASGARLSFFIFISILTTLLFNRISPDEFNETKLESTSKKGLLAICATILVMIFSFHVLPVTEFLTPGTPIQSLFAPAEYFFWWLIAPLVVLFWHK